MSSEWKKKLTSRKFWAAVSALVVALCVLFGVDELTVEKLAATVSALGVLMAYIFTEGALDEKSLQQAEKHKTDGEEK